MKALRVIGVVAVIALLLVASVGCNTMRGLGRDIQKGGAKIEEAAD